MNSNLNTSTGIDPKHLPTIESISGFTFMNYFISKFGIVYRIASDKKRLLPRDTFKSVAGTVFFRAGNNTINLDRLIEAWKHNDCPAEVTIEQYNEFRNNSDRQSKDDRKGEIQRRIWQIRRDYLHGEDVIDIAKKYDKSVNYVNMLCMGFSVLDDYQRSVLSKFCGGVVDD